MQKRALIGLFVLLCAALACRPVIAIGGEEILCLVILAVILVGAPLYRFLRRVESFRRYTRKDK